MSSRDDIYREVLEKISYMIEEETDEIAILATVACELHHAFDHYHWTGFYRAVLPDELVVGPYQGTHGCLRIKFGDGVCGTAAQTQQTQLVPDVHAFPGHIACSTSTQSEIVVPVVFEGLTLAVFDVDSDLPDAFNVTDQANLEALAASLAARIHEARSIN